MNLPATFNSPVQTQLSTQADTAAPANPFVYSDEAKIFNTLISDHTDEVTRVQRRRESRKNRLNVKEMRDKGQLLPDETVIPDRTIDTNIRIEKSPYVKYLESPTTILSFEEPSASQINLMPLAAWHAGIVRVGDWKDPHIKNQDALLLHGCGYMELVYDKNSPSHTVVEYIRRENLIFPKGTRDLQACGRMYRCYPVTKAQLSVLAAEFGFDEAQLAKVKTRFKDTQEEIKLYKGFLRADDGVVMVAWRADDNVGNDNWLKAPEPHQIGIFDVTPSLDPKKPPTVVARKLTKIPIIDFPYHLEEDEVILETQGRSALDLHVQDCLTAMWTGTANGVVRASRFYPSRKVTPGETPKNDELFTLKHGAVFEGDFNIFQPSWPNSIAIAAAQSLAGKKAQEIGATNYAAMNRNDTRKTATELTMAREESDNLSGPNISLYSSRMLRLELLRWEVIKSGIAVEAAFNVPPNLKKFNPPPSIPLAVIMSPTLNVQMAADAQVVRRAQRQSRFLENWPIVSESPYALPYLESFLEEMFPDDFPKWKAVVQNADARVASLTDMLNRAKDMLVNLPPDAVPPEARKDFVNFLNQLDEATNPQPQPK